MVSPADFIPIAEQTGLIVPIGKVLLERVVADLVHLPAHISVAVNLSPIQLQNQDFASHLHATLAGCGIAPSRLCLEVTEAVLLKDDDQTIKTLVHLRALGIRIAMDDFGTGYSSLSYLRRFPFDKIKIDRTFIQDIGDNAQSRAIVQAVVDLAHGLNMQTTAEGVETKAQLDCLTAMGCNEIQGYYFGRPAPATEAFAAFRSPAN
jgi:EAL domain-containing protein (putative c-di-GMP-specific phosphodiesterase class I)